jgi:chromosomal replication initiation ATPase DnaA
VNRRIGQLAFELGHPTSTSEVDFQVADGNREAAAWIGRWPDWPARGLVIHGPPGAGKSHLLAVWRRRTGALAVDAESLPPASGAPTVARDVAVAIDDADRIAGGSAEVALLHLYNRVVEAEGWLLLTGREPPSRWPLGLPDLASRLKALPAVALAPPDDALLAAVLVKLFADHQLTVSEEVVTLLLSRMERSFAAARETVAALDAASLAEQRKIDKALVRELTGERRPRKKRSE